MSLTAIFENLFCELVTFLYPAHLCSFTASVISYGFGYLPFFNAVAHYATPGGDMSVWPPLAIAPGGHEPQIYPELFD
jgi:hypothetical protein